MIHPAFVCDTSLLSLPLSSCKWTSTDNQTTNDFHCLEAKTTLQKVGLSEEEGDVFPGVWSAAGLY